VWLTSCVLLSTNGVVTKSRAWIVPKKIITVLIFAGLLSGRFLKADDNPFDGYSDNNYYTLDYSSGSFVPGNSSDVQVDVTFGASPSDFSTLSIDVDTGSRGIYVSSDQLPADFIAKSTGTPYTGQIALDSSGRVSSGMWVPTQVTFAVTNQNGVAMNVTSTVNVLDVTTLSAEGTQPVFFGTKVNSGTLALVGSGTTPVVLENGTTSTYGVYLTTGQSITYADNKGLINDVSNFGIGFDLSGAPGGTGPVGYNQNQIYNPLINIAGMQPGGNLVAGYVVESTGIQLGLTGTDTGYAYTKLNPTVYTNNNSQPDWQTPMGKTSVSGTGSVVMDSGIPEAFISATGLKGADLTGTISVDLMNSGGLAGYKIDMSNSANYLNPSAITIVPPATDGIYSQNYPPYQSNFFNTGRNVFDDFNMLYDAENGYMGILPNQYGETDPNIFFAAQEGGFPDPIPEPGGGSTAMILLGLLFAVGIFRGLQKSAASR